MRWIGGRRQAGERDVTDIDAPESSAAAEMLTGPLPSALIEAAAPVDLEAERQILIDLLIYAWDRAKSNGVRERLAAGLAQVGVEVVRPDGELFDPSAHEVGGVEPTPDQALHNTVAETETAGFRDRGRWIREPVVVVFRPA